MDKEKEEPKVKQPKDWSPEDCYYGRPDDVSYFYEKDWDEK